MISYSDMVLNHKARQWEKTMQKLNPRYPVRALHCIAATLLLMTVAMSMVACGLITIRVCRLIAFPSELALAALFGLLLWLVPKAVRRLF